MTTVTSKSASNIPENADISAPEVIYSDHSTNEAALKPQDYAKSILRLEVASYISQMSTELSTMARNSDMPLLSYFLEMSAAEARATDCALRDALQVGSEPDTTSALAKA
jgi:hypothetical protein